MNYTIVNSEEYNSTEYYLGPHNMGVSVEF